MMFHTFRNGWTPCLGRGMAREDKGQEKKNQPGTHPISSASMSRQRSMPPQSLSLRMLARNPIQHFLAAQPPHIAKEAYSTDENNLRTHFASARCGGHRQLKFAWPFNMFVWSLYLYCLFFAFARPIFSTSILPFISEKSHLPETISNAYVCHGVKFHTHFYAQQCQSDVVFFSRFSLCPCPNPHIHLAVPGSLPSNKSRARNPRIWKCLRSFQWRWGARAKPDADHRCDGKNIQKYNLLNAVLLGGDSKNTPAYF